MANYKTAITWIVQNDDTEFLSDEGSPLSVTASLVSDIFGKGDAQVREDLLREQKRIARREAIHALRHGGIK